MEINNNTDLIVDIELNQSYTNQELINKYNEFKQDCYNKIQNKVCYGKITKYLVHSYTFNYSLIYPYNNIPNTNIIEYIIFKLSRLFTYMLFIPIDIITYCILNSLITTIILITYTINMYLQLYKMSNDMDKAIIWMSSIYISFGNTINNVLLMDSNTITFKYVVYYPAILLLLLYFGLQIGFVINLFMNNQMIYILYGLLTILNIFQYILYPYYIRNTDNILLKKYFNIKPSETVVNDIFIKKYLEDFIFVNLKLNKYTIDHKCETEDCRDCECSICSNKNNENKLITNCNHIFDKDCLLKWIDTDLTHNNKITCPYCRSNL